MQLPPSVSNPFLASVVADPWKPADIDVPQIHREISDVCYEAVEHVRATGTSAGILIHGQAGSGKTHLLARLRQRLAECPPPPYPDLQQARQLFVSVRLATNPRRIWRHVRQRLVDDLLLRRLPERLSQLEHMLATRLAELGEGAGDLGRWWEYKREEDPGHLDELLYDLAVETQADDRLMIVLGQIVRATHKRDARSWLRGDPLPEAALQQLGLATSGAEWDDPEEDARAIVLALCRLAGPRIPVVFCFDQVEALELAAGNQLGLQAFGQLSADLYDQCGNVVLISCIQSDVLANMKSALPTYAYGRVTSFANRALAPLLWKTAIELVAARLEASPEVVHRRPDSADRVWPLSIDEIRKFVGDAGRTPRELLSFCANQFADLKTDPRDKDKTVSPPPTEAEFLEQDWQQRYETAFAANTSDQTDEILSEGLPLLLQVAEPDWKLVEDKSLRDVDFVLAGPQGEARVGISLCTQPNMTSLAGRLRHLREHVEQGKLQKLILLRDPRTPISPGAKATQKHLDELRKHDAEYHRPSVEALAALEVLRSLLADAQSGDLSNGGRTIEVNSVRAWLVQNLSEPLRDLANLLVTPARIGSFENGSDPDEHLDRLVSLLNERHMAPLEEVAHELNCPADQLRASIQRNPDRIGYLPGPPAVVFEKVPDSAAG